MAQREKNRLFFANRVAQTELVRAHQAKVAAEFMADATIDVVEVRINPMHPKRDICDLHAHADLFGLGAGCYPKAQAPRPPFHPFCGCRIRSRPDLAASAARRVPMGEAAYLRGLAPDVAARVMGSRERAAAVMNGAPVADIINAGQDPAYRLLRLGDAAAVEHALGAEDAVMAHPQSVPNAEQAVIHPDKRRRYALDPGSEIGGNKARVFAAALGFTQENAGELERQRLRGLPGAPSTERRATVYGRTFSADIRVSGPVGSGIVRTGWQIDVGSEAPRLVSAYVLKG